MGIAKFSGSGRTLHPSLLGRISLLLETRNIARVEQRKSLRDGSQTLPFLFFNATEGGGFAGNSGNSALQLEQCGRAGKAEPRGFGLPGSLHELCGSFKEQMRSVLSTWAQF